MPGDNTADKSADEFTKKSATKPTEKYEECDENSEKRHEERSTEKYDDENKGGESLSIGRLTMYSALTALLRRDDFRDLFKIEYNKVSKYAAIIRTKIPPDYITAAPRNDDILSEEE